MPVQEKFQNIKKGLNSLHFSKISLHFFFCSKNVTTFNLVTSVEKEKVLFTERLSIFIQ